MATAGDLEVKSGGFTPDISHCANGITLRILAFVKTAHSLIIKIKIRINAPYDAFYAIPTYRILAVICSTLIITGTLRLL